jgi:serine O-acetyltransferase
MGAVQESATAPHDVLHPSLRRLIAADLRAKAEWCYDRRDWKGVVKVILTDGSAAMILYRLMQWSCRLRIVPLEMLFNKMNSVFCSCIIGRGADFGPGFVLIHSQGVVINGQVRGGSNIYVEHQVTIGAERRQSPLLGNNVFIGAGAKIIGPVTIGDGARVGANAVVVHDVPTGATVAGIPARVVRQRSAPVAEANATSSIGLLRSASASSRAIQELPNGGQRTDGPRTTAH